MSGGSTKAEAEMLAGSEVERAARATSPLSPASLTSAAKPTLLCLLVTLVLVAAGCGGAKVTTTTNAQGKATLVCAGHVRLARTKFLLHSGLAFGAFHRYILKPYRAGTFRKGASGRTAALAKAAASAVFAYHELKVARNDAVCDGPALRRVANGLSGALTALSPLRALTGGQGLGAIAAAAQAFDHLGGVATKNGVTIKDRGR